jgi:7,8-dihydro-6-hydroxymethylpterin-pyrophosphokinase
LELLTYLKRLEQQLGRVASVRWGPRAIDIDILFFDDLVLHSETLVLPHPQLHLRAFVLVPLAELAPQLSHPILAKTAQQLAASARATDVKLVAKHW